MSISFFIAFAAWLVRLEKGKLERTIPAVWNPRVSLQLDQLLDIRERLADYRTSELGRP